MFCWPLLSGWPSQLLGLLDFTDVQCALDGQVWTSDKALHQKVRVRTEKVHCRQFSADRSSDYIPYEVSGVKCQVQAGYERPIQPAAGSIPALRPRTLLLLHHFLPHMPAPCSALLHPIFGPLHSHALVVINSWIFVAVAVVNFCCQVQLPWHSLYDIWQWGKPESVGICHKRQQRPTRTCCRHICMSNYLLSLCYCLYVVLCDYLIAPVVV